VLKKQGRGAADSTGLDGQEVRRGGEVGKEHETKIHKVLRKKGDLRVIFIGRVN